MAGPGASRGRAVPTALDLALVALVAVGVALGWLRDVVPHWGTRAYTRGDGQFQAWTIDWVQEAILGRHPLWDAGIYHPAPRALAFSDHLLGLAPLLLPLRALGLSPAGQLNTAVVLGTVVDALAAYLLVRVLVRHRAAAVVGAVAFVAGPFPHQLTLQLHMLWRPALPVVVALVWVLADRRAGVAAWSRVPSDRWLGVLLAVAVGWQGLVSFYGAVLVGLVLVLAAAARAGDLGWPGLRRVGVAALAGAAAVALTLPPYLANARDYEGFERTLAETRAFRGRLLAVEGTNHLWGDTLPTGGGLPAFAGAALWLLAVVGLVAAVRGRRRLGAATREWRAARFGLLATVVGGVLALGAGTSGPARWTPYGLLFELVPGFSVVRAPGRLWVVGLVGLVVLAAGGVVAVVGAVGGALPRRWPRRVAPVAVALVAMVALVGEGLSTPEPVGAAAETAIDRRLAALDRPGAVLYLPIGASDIGLILGGADAVYRSTTHGRPVLNGYSGFQPASAAVLADRLEDLRGPRGLACLTATGTAYVVVTTAVAGTPWQRLVDPSAAAPLELVARADGELLYEVPDRPEGGADGGSTACPLPGPRRGA